MGKQHKFVRVSVITAFILLCAAYFLCSAPFAIFPFVEEGLENLVGKELFSFYTAQLSLTFISISVLSVLSEKNVIIYWENVAESKLIKPVFGCFAAFTCYSIVANICSAIGVFLSSVTVFTLFFMINVVVLILLTHSIIDVYYGKDSKKDKLIKELTHDFKDCRDSGIYQPDSPYSEKIQGLQQRALTCHNESDFASLRELYDLYANHTELFSIPEAKPFTDALVSTFDRTTAIYFIDMLRNLVHNEKVHAESIIADIRKLLKNTDSEKSLEETIRELSDAKFISLDKMPQADVFHELKSRCTFPDIQLWQSMASLPALKYWMSELNQSTASDEQTNDLERIFKLRSMCIYNIDVLDTCIQKGHPEFIDKLLFTQHYFDNVVFRFDEETEEYDLRLKAVNTVYSLQRSIVSAADPVYVMWHAVKEMYMAIIKSPHVVPSIFYPDFPILDVMSCWCGKHETELIELMEKLIEPPQVHEYYV